uniref:Uncharacterized protein n=1 Tax=Anopheles farauti TaxID=69004 RepID=A0A182QXC6_9DIPT
MFNAMGHVEQQALEEQHERYPLVVAVVRSLLVIVAQPGMGYVRAELAAMLAGKRERVGDPAVRVDHMPGHGTVVNAGYRIADQVVCSDNNTAGEQNCTGDAIVTPKHHVIYDSFVVQVAHLHESGHSRDESKHSHLKC